MEIIAVILLIIALLLFQAYKDFKKQRGGETNVQEWNHLAPISQRFGSKDPGDSGYVYFVREPVSSYIKIGKAKDPKKRIGNDFGTLMPFDFEIEHLIESRHCYKTERLFHQYFSDKRGKGEWFDLTERDLNWVRQEKFPIDIADSIKGY